MMETLLQVMDAQLLAKLKQLMNVLYLHLDFQFVRRFVVMQN
jgi:hypothetical protein